MNGLKMQMIAACALLFLVFSCEKDKRFTIRGNVSEGKGKTMFFEHVGISKIDVLDSVKLDDKGSFDFRHLNSGEPDFYRLRLDAQLINIAIDSSEVVDIQANASNFAQGYAVEGSAECSKIKELTMSQLKASIAYNKLRKSYNDGSVTVDQYMEQIIPVLNEYKESAKNYIYTNPKSSSAYFALFQQINGMLIFDPYDKEDYKAFGAVATSWDQYFPESARSKHLYNMALQALKAIRGERPVEYDVIESNAHLEMKLPDIHEKQISLFESCKGKLALIDFTAYQMQESPFHNIQLNEIYEKYKSRGFEIYQVSFDPDVHFWKNASANLPWICVRDPQSVYSQNALNYNVKNLPTAFLMNRNGEIVKRIDSFDHLEKEVDRFIK